MQFGGLPADKLFPEEFYNSSLPNYDYKTNQDYYNPQYSPKYDIRNRPVIMYSRLAKVPTINYDPENDKNYLVQKQITKYLHYKFLDKWLYEDYPELFKYVKLGKSNKSDSSDVLEKKADYIEENILTFDKTRKILKKIMLEEDLKWYELPYFEGLVKKTFAHYIKKKLKGDKDD